MEGKPPEFPVSDPGALLEHTRWMRELARRLVLDGSRVDDLVQEAWTAALTRPPGESVPLRAWLAGVLRKRALFDRRTAARARHREESEARANRVPSAAELNSRTEQQKLLLDEVQALPEKYREVLLLRYYEDLGPARIAAHLGLPVNTVHTRLQRALERMRARLDASHAGDRSAWALALLPLARAGRGAGPGLVSMVTPKTSTLWILMHSWKIALSAVLAVGAVVAVAKLRPTPLADLRQFTTAEEAALELRTSLRALSAPPGSAVERAPVAVPDRVVRGRVLGPSGEPVAGARIFRRDAPRPNVFYVDGDPPRGGWAVSDGAGGFQRALEPGEPAPWLAVAHDDYLPVARVTPALEEGETLLRMAPVRRTLLDVEVVDRTSGRPVPRFDLSASVRMAGGGEAADVLWTTYSEQHLDGGGEVEIEYAEGLPLRVAIDALGLTKESDRSELERIVEPVPDGRTWVRFALDLDAPERASANLAFGRVVDAATGEPVGGAEIHVLPRAADGRFARDPRRVQSFGDGSFRTSFEGGGPRVRVRAHHPRYEVAEVESDGSVEVVLRLQRRGALRGTLIDASGRPLPHAPLLLVTAEEEVRDTVERDTNGRWRGATGDEGRFEFANLREGRYHLFVLRAPKDPDERALTSASYRLAAGEEREVTVELAPPDRVLVEGRVAPPPGVEDACVPVFLPYAGEAGWTRSEARYGEYSAGGLARGRYLVLLAPVDDGDRAGPFALLPGVAIEGFGHQRLDLAFPDGSIEGRLVDDFAEGGLRVQAVPTLPPGFAHDVLASGGLRELLGTSVGADGTFSLPFLAAGSWQVEVHDRQGALLAEQQVQVSGRTVLAPWRFSGAAGE